MSWAPLKLKTGEGARRAMSRSLILEPRHRPAWGFMKKKLSLGAHHGCLRARLKSDSASNDLMFCSKVNYQSSGQPRSVKAERDQGHQPPDKTKSTSRTHYAFPESSKNALVSQRKSCTIYHSDAQDTLAGHVPRQRMKITNM